MFKPSILIIGSSGMLGGAILRYLSETGVYNLFALSRSLVYSNSFSDPSIKFIQLSNFEDHVKLQSIINRIKPDIVINCAGLIKQISQSVSSSQMISINSTFPHVLATLCDQFDIRFIHFSTDCVFSGAKSSAYVETDPSDANDLYGKSKYLGECTNSIYKNSLTLRTSIIGHGIVPNNSLIDWFLSCDPSTSISGFKNAIFSGLPTVEIASILHNYVLRCEKHLSGLFHLSAAPISKYKLLSLVADIYSFPVDIIPTPTPVINRALCSHLFASSTGYTAPSWATLIYNMRASYEPPS